MDHETYQNQHAQRWDRFAVFRRDLAEETTGGDPEMFAELAQDFLETVEELTEQLELAQQADNSPLAGQAAHSMKSESGMLGGERLQAIAMELETRAKEDDHTKWQALVTPMLEAKEEFCRALEEAK